MFALLLHVQRPCLFDCRSALLACSQMLDVAHCACLPALLPAGELIGRELAPVYAAACGPAASQPADLPAQLPLRLMELLVVAGQHLYHDIAGEGGAAV